MMVCITGTPGTGKSALAGELAQRGYTVVRLADTVAPYVLERDPERDTLVVDVDRWVEEFTPVDGIAEGHLAHLLSCDRTVVLRCRPDVLRRRLESRGYRPGKIDENVETEALDVILIETLEEQSPSSVLEIDTTDLSVPQCADLVEGFLKGSIPSSHGNIDWSEYLGVIT